MHKRYTQRTVEWGHWAITLMDIQRDPSKNYGVIVATLPFPTVNGMGPCDRPHKELYGHICANWIERGELPPSARDSAVRKSAHCGVLRGPGPSGRRRVHLGLVSDRLEPRFGSQATVPSPLGSPLTPFEALGAPSRAIRPARSQPSS